MKLWSEPYFFVRYINNARDHPICFYTYTYSYVISNQFSKLRLLLYLITLPKCTFTIAKPQCSLSLLLCSSETLYAKVYLHVLSDTTHQQNFIISYNYMYIHAHAYLATTFVFNLHSDPAINALSYLQRYKFILLSMLHSILQKVGYTWESHSIPQYTEMAKTTLILLTAGLMFMAVLNFVQSNELFYIQLQSIYLSTSHFNLQGTSVKVSHIHNVS